MIFLLGCTALGSLFGKEPQGDDSEAPDSLVDTGEQDDLSWVDPARLPAGDDPCREPVLLFVLDVIDGDTAVIGRSDGFDKETVRFIGIDTPEVAHNGDPAECFGPEAAALVKEMLEDKPIWLTFDAECTDQYDRTLAYLHRGPSDFVQRTIVRNGWGYDFPYYPNVAFEDELAADEASARQQDLGLWADCH